ncbi:FUSC family protein [Klebsiella pneumoniae subsp. pneumoniae]|nr:FUSC family protein [Klebsiella pneumoniae subsp. pneumoniae]
MGDQYQWTSCAAALTLASICCVLYSVSASPFRSLTLLMQTLVLLSLFSFVVKFGLMVQVTDLWQFLLFLFPLLTTMQLLKLQWPKYAGPVGTAYRLYGLVYRRHQPAGVRLCGLFQ